MDTWKSSWTVILLLWVNSIRAGGSGDSFSNLTMISGFLEKLIFQIYYSCKKAKPDVQTIEELSRLFLKDFFPSFLPDICFDVNNEQELLYFTSLSLYVASIKCSIDEVIKNSCNNLDDETQKVVHRFLAQMMSSDDGSMTVEHLEEAMQQSLDPSELTGKKSLSPTKCQSSPQEFFDSPEVKRRKAKSYKPEMRIFKTALEEAESCNLAVIQENTRLKEELKKCESLLKEKKKICEYLQEDSSRSFKKFPDFTEQDRKLKKMTIKIKELKKEIEAVTTENLSLHDQIERASKEASRVDKDYKDCLHALNKCLEELDKCSEELHFSRSNINALQAKISHLEKEKVDLLDEVQEQSRSRRSLDPRNMSLPEDPEPASVVIELELKEKDELIQKLQTDLIAKTFKEQIKQKDPRKETSDEARKPATPGPISCCHRDQTTRDGDEEKLLQLTESAANLPKAVSPPLEDESDVESLHSFHYSPKVVDIPAVCLAKRLFTLDGFKKSDVSGHLSKNNDYSKAVAEEYLKYFQFEGDTLNVALRKFLKQFSLAGETQKRERVLVHFSKRYLDCNPGGFNSQDAVHTLTCAIMLLNTDLHGQIIGRKMTCTKFIENLSELNDGENFPREVLKGLYQAIKSYPLEWALDDEGEETTSVKAGGVGVGGERVEGMPGVGAGTIVATGKGFFDVPSSQPAIEYKKGYVMCKSCVEPNGKKTPLGKRGWKMFYCTLRDLVLYLHKDEHGFRKSQLSDNLHNAIRIHHSLATKATDYVKKLHVFRLETADQEEYLFQTSDSKELQSWIDTINFVCASFSAQPLPGGVGSQKRFQRPLLPCSHTKLNLREQLQSHEEMVHNLESELDQHRRHTPERGAKALTVQNHKEKDAYLQYELKRYKTYALLLKSRISQYPEMEGSLVESSIGETEEDEPKPDQQQV